MLSVLLTMAKISWAIGIVVNMSQTLKRWEIEGVPETWIEKLINKNKEKNGNT